MASLLSWLGGVAKGVERELNPFDGGATYSNPNPQRQPISIPNYHPNPGVVNSINQATGSNYAQGGGPAPAPTSVLRQRPPIVIPNYHTVQAPIQAPKLNMPLETAKQAGLGILTNAGHALQAIARTAPEIGGTILHPNDFSYHPNSKIEQLAFGKTPVQNIQAKVHDTQAKKGNVMGFLEGAASLAQDVPTGIGAAKTLGKAGKAIHETGQVGAAGKNIPKVVKTAPLPRPGGDWQLNHTYEDYANATRKAGGTPATKEQYNAAFKGPNESVAAPLRPAEANTALNPHKADLPVVQHGDYGQVIANEQAASKPTQFAGDRWAASMKVLQKKNPSEYSNFWRYFRDPGFKDAPKSPQLEAALKAWRTVDDRIHGTSQALGGNTNYLKDHGLHPWNLPEGFSEHVQNGGDPRAFPGLSNISRQHGTIAEGEAAGLTLGTNPLGEGSNYIGASSAILRRRAIVKGLTEADSHMTDKSHAFDIGGGESIPLSKEGRNAVRGLVKSSASDNRAIKGLRTANTGTKSAILSLGQFHPINISVLRAGPTLAIPKPTSAIYRNATTGKVGVDLTMGSHPIRAVKGVAKTFRPLLPGGKGAVERTLNRALNDGTVDKAAKIGMPYGAQGFDAEGSFLKGGVGHKMVFERQMPMMHDQVARSIISDLEKRGIPLDSAEARAAGKAGNNLMGFVNAEAQKVSPSVNRKLGDWLLAKQFTHSKFSQMRTAGTKGGVGGAYARANVAANVAASTAIITGLGYLAHQQSDNLRDMFLRALIDPAAPTSSTDNKGNNVKLRLPGTDTSDIAKLLGIKLVRNADGHLGVSWNPGNMPSTVADFARNRLAPWSSAGVKLATNTTYAGKPLYDPNASGGTQAQQAGTSILEGLLPIGAQGLAFTGPVKDHLPQGVQDVLNAQTPGTNPVVKSIGSSFGLTPSTDMTTGKGLDTSRYFNALDQAKKGLNSHEKDVLDLYSGSKKNPVTGKYDVQPNANDTQTKARALLDQPKVIDRLIALNATLKDQGQSTDPLWTSEKDQITKVLAYQAMPPGGPDRTHWLNQNKSWYLPLASSRSDFFNSLPKGDPNKPAAPIEYPNASPQVAQKQQTFFNLPDAASRAKYISENPDLQQQLDKQVQYNNDMRTATGYSPLDIFPTATPQVQKIIDTYNAIPKGGGKRGGNLYRSQWIQSHPNEYAAMTKYFTQASLYGAEQSLAQAQFKDTGVDQKGLKDIANLGQYDIGKTTDANGNTFYTLGGGGGSSKYGGSGSGKTKLAKTITTGFKTAGAMKAPKAPSIKIKSPKSATFKAPSAKKLAVSKIPSSYTHRKLG